MPRRTVRLPICSARRHPDADGGDNHIDHEQRHEGVDDGFVDGIADRLGATATDHQSAIAGHQPGDQPEQRGLDAGDDDLRDAGQQGDPAAKAPGLTFWTNTENT